jgi:hypothetical protein
VAELELTEEQADALRKQLCNGEKASSDVRIVILQRGWVMVGRYSEDGSECKLTDCSNIRIWGTTRGLGEIAEDGPHALTKLDKQPVTRFHKLTVIATIDCVESKWKKYL